ISKTPNSSSQCDDNMTSWNQSMQTMYTYFYLLLFIPGLLLNTTALWVLCRYIRKKTKAVIFMINLAFADLAHILSLPLRIYYYFTHTWPFGHGMCLFCFYLKYLNMYAAIMFLVCISVQRCVFLLDPFFARRWRRRYDLLISSIVWLVVGLGCSPFILMRSMSIPNSSRGECFKDLPMRRLSQPLAISMMTLAELFGFIIPLACISYTCVHIAHSLNQRKIQDQHSPYTLNSSRRALRMVLSCSALFLFCFAPYHLNFLLYLMVSQEMVSHCPTRQAVLKFHPVSLCLASLSCCLNPLLYYFLTAEFRISPTQRNGPQRLMSMESSYSDKE
uniref:G-protein coupled receptors family 1 profile domain-containing protein n=1 Tax=Monopterus albus TaxID=43700 RepID=A0A3Q3J8S2_MONAL